MSKHSVVRAFVDFRTGLLYVAGHGWRTTAEHTELVGLKKRNNEVTLTANLYC